MKKDRIFSFILAMLMLIAATITVNKAVFSHNMQGKETFDDKSPEAVRENVTVGPDGSVIVHTAGLHRTISGYAGPVPLDIHISDAKITEIHALANAESPSFFQRASTLFDSWIGKTPDQKT
ncbi:MAG: hypothetical protein K2K75_01095 [Muribaculaceae bacterium]|nr:hypothetical protein [Muribaculaceae bacterium]